MRIKNFFKRNRVTRKEAQAIYPFTGSCPVRVRTGDGKSVGRCYHSMYGNICPTHGNLSDLLVKIREGGPEQYEIVEESALPPREDREFIPSKYKDALGI